MCLLLHNLLIDFEHLVATRQNCVDFRTGKVVRATPSKIGLAELLERFHHRHGDVCQVPRIDEGRRRLKGPVMADHVDLPVLVV